MSAAELPGEGRAEWLETDGLGGFASGTVSLQRSRRYHALLLAATRPPSGRAVLVPDLELVLETPSGPRFLSSHRYAPGVTWPDGADRLVSFEQRPWPTWTWSFDGLRVHQELVVPHGSPAVALRWRVEGARPGMALVIRPLLAGRDYHSLQRENPGFRFDAEGAGGRVSWQPYDAWPRVEALCTGRYEHAPDWYRNFLYEEEQARGLDAVEDLGSPGVFRHELDGRPEPAALVLWTGHAPWQDEPDAARVLEGLCASELRRRSVFAGVLERAADAYLVRRGEGHTIVAGYPWFTDWGRDTFIALRGLCLATGRVDVARRILLEWAGAVSEGMVPNRFPDGDEPPEYNAVDASLWYVVAVHETLALGTRMRVLHTGDAERLQRAVLDILEGYARGTRHGIRMDADGLLASGGPGVQLTWMDARVDGREITPRAGKPVEVQALWINALEIGSRLDERWAEPLARARAAFEERFWNEAEGCLHDVVDVDHVSGAVDASFRPNQVLAVGGLPFPVLRGERARRVVDAVEARLLTPLGLRSLAPSDPAYRGRYAGGVAERDGAYHQGTVWPWLLGPFVDAWLDVRGGGLLERAEARKRFLAPLLAHLAEAGLGHVSEVADADAPHRPGGCPFQAWSVGELLRLQRRLGPLHGGLGTDPARVVRDVALALRRQSLY